MNVSTSDFRPCQLIDWLDLKLFLEANYFNLVK